MALFELYPDGGRNGSCSTDDDPTGVEVSKIDIIGTWEVTANSWSDSEGDSGTNDHKSAKLSL